MENAAVEREFRAAEYEALRSEVLARQAEAWRLEKFGLGGSAAIAAWLFANADAVRDVREAWWLPAIFIAACACRFAAVNIHLRYRCSDYLLLTEQYFLGEEGGWEVWFRKKNLNETIAFSIVWGVAFISSMILVFRRGI